MSPISLRFYVQGAHFAHRAINTTRFPVRNHFPTSFCDSNFDFLSSSDGEVRRDVAAEIARVLKLNIRALSLITNTLIKDKEIEVHYLGYYLPWHPQGAYYYAVENGEFRASPERTPGTYSKYNSIDDKIDDFHFYTTFIKFGYGRATTDASQEIRNKHITREEGIALVKRYDGELPKRDLAFFLEYTGIDEEYFWYVIDRYREISNVWKKVNGEWLMPYLPE